MNISIADVMRAMLGAGCSAEQIVSTVEGLTPAATVTRSTAAVRQERYRDRKCNAGVTGDVTSVTNVTRDVTGDAPLPPPKEIPHTPLENNPPLPPSPVTSREVTSPTEKIEKIEKISLDRETVSPEAKAKLRALGEEWNAFAGELMLPRILEIRPGSIRERAALARIRDGTDFTLIFAKIRGSPFLRGEKGSSPAAFDWIINPTNVLKIVEGNYDEIRRLPTRAYA